ncbi:MAG: ethanolamine utilization protein EutN [Opitutales bacterium]|nr:ethanolamine utilization protein EutN [Opitutales bacterium]
MQTAKIVGNLVMNCAHPSARGNAFFLCQPIDENGNDAGEIVVAISPFGGGLGSKVLISTDGSATREYVRDPKSPIRNSIICVIDD